MSKAKLIKACLKVKNPYGVVRTINSETDSQVVLDLRDSATLAKFKKELILEASLSTSQERKYLLWVFLAKNDQVLD